MAENLDATTSDTAPICKELGFQNHGLVVRDASGTVLWKQPDHEVVIEDVQAAIKELLDNG